MNYGDAPQEFFCLVYVDGVALPVWDPTPRDGFILYKREDFAATRVARQRDRSHRMHRHARQLLPDVAGTTVLTEEDLVDLMDGDIDLFCGIVQGPREQGAYVIYVPHLIDDAVAQVQQVDEVNGSAPTVNSGMV